MTTLQEWLNERFSTQNKKQVRMEIDIEFEINCQRKSLNITEELEGGELDLSEFVSLEKILIEGVYLKTPLTKLILGEKPKLKILDCSVNQLTSLDVSSCSNLKQLDCYENKLISLDVSKCPKLTDLYCNAELFTENKITGLEKASIIRLDCRGGNLLKKSQDPKFIWEVFVRKYKIAFPEMKLLEISDLNELASQLNQETAQDWNFLFKFCRKDPSKFLKNFGGNYYWILDQLANTILARCLVIQNRLYEGKDEEYEKHLEELAKDHFKCNLMNPKNPQASLYKTREKLVQQALKGDIELLSRLQDLPYLKTEYKFNIRQKELTKWESIKAGLEKETDLTRLANGAYWDIQIKKLQDNLLLANKQSIVLKNRREYYYGQLAKRREQEIKIENMPSYKVD